MMLSMNTARIEAKIENLNNEILDLQMDLEFPMHEETRREINRKIKAKREILRMTEREYEILRKVA